MEHPPSQDLLRLATYAFLSPWYEDVLDGWTPQRKPGSKVGLAFSGGIDSTAAMLLLPEDTALVHHRRTFQSILKHDGADQLFDVLRKSTGRTILSVPSDHEQIRAHWGRPRGFSTDLASAVHLILMADFLDLEGHCLRHAHRQHLSVARPSLARFLIQQLVASSRPRHVQRWPRHRASHRRHQPSQHGPIGARGWPWGRGQLLFARAFPGVRRCWKCFHKHTLLGREADFEAREIQTFLAKRPLKTATHVLWWINEHDRWDLIPDLDI